MDLAPCATNVRVAVRVRPLSSRERQLGSTECLSIIEGTSQIVAGPDKSFTFDDVFETDIGQMDIFSAISEPILNYFLTGYNCTILAYGQTGSGKTYTMGTGLDGNMDDYTQGIVPRSIEFLLGSLSTSLSSDSWEMFISFLEIYNEEIIDLLAPVSTSGKKNTLCIREDAGGEIFLAGIKEEAVRSSSDIFRFHIFYTNHLLSLLQKGTLCRTTKSTDMNLVSSRSHAIFTVSLKQSNDGQHLYSKLHFVDLAGSERLKRTNASGERAKESISINSGLLALGNVISALGDESKHATHIPYRDSKLTRLLQDSLGGNSRTLMIACVSPSTDSYQETINTLKYANRARNIKNRVNINQDPNGSTAFEIIQLKKLVASLKQELLQTRSAAHTRHSMADACTPIRGSKASIENSQDYQKALHKNNELARRVEELQREKLEIEAERDALKSQVGPVDGEKVSIMRQHLSTIAELRARLNEKATKKNVRFHSDTKIPRSPGEIVAQSSELVDRSRREITGKLAAIEKLSSANITAVIEDIEMQSISPDQFKAAVETRVQSLIRPLRDELGIKEELTHSLHQLQLEYMAMQQKYNERLKFVHDTLNTVQRDRDSALSSMAVHSQPPTGGNSRATRIKYEDRIKRMGKEMNELKERIDSQNKETSSRTTNSDALLRSLRQTIQTLKAEKSKLQSQLQEDSLVIRNQRLQKESDSAAESADLRARERKAVESARKWHKAYDFQKGLLQKRIEQCALARVKIRSLLQLMRRNRVKLDSGYDTPGWRQILHTPNASNSASRDMDIVDSPLAAKDVHMRIMSAAPSPSPHSRLAYGWVPTEMARHLSPERPKPLDFFAQIADAASLSLRASSQNPFMNSKHNKQP